MSIRGLNFPWLFCPWLARMLEIPHGVLIICFTIIFQYILYFYITLFNVRIIAR
jgi:hypothetical protein